MRCCLCNSRFDIEYGYERNSKKYEEWKEFNMNQENKFKICWVCWKDEQKRKAVLNIPKDTSTENDFQKDMEILFSKKPQEQYEQN